MQKTGTYLAIDTEFTGHHPHLHGLVECGYLILDSELQELYRFSSFVCPPEGYQVSEEARNFMDFDFKQIQNGLTYTQLADQIITDVNTWCCQKPILIGHFLAMDFSYLNNIFSHAGKDQELWNTCLGHSTIDTKSLANVINLQAELNGQAKPFPITSLSKPGGLTERLGITDYESHTALGDARATVGVLEKLLTYL